MLMPSVLAAHTLTTKISATVLSRQGIGPTLLIAATGEKLGQLSCSHDSEPGFPPAAGSEG